MKITLARDEVTSEGHTIRRIYDLQLVRNHTPFFALTWTAMHPIDETSPFYGETPESLAADNAELLVTLTGIDETVAQTIHSRQSYAVREILWNMRFVDILSTQTNGQRIINYHNFHQVVPLENR